MTTATETLADLHEWLAERLPGLQRPCPHGSLGSGMLNTPTCPTCEPRGWVPNVTTDGVLEALRAHGLHVIFTRDGAVGLAKQGHWGDDVVAGFDGSFDYIGLGKTTHEALCRAAKQALA